MGPQVKPALPTTVYKVRTYNTSGTLVAEITDFLSLAYTKRVNEPGLASIVLSGSHNVIGLIDHKYQVEIWRCNQRYDIDWYCDFYGLYMDQERFYRQAMPHFVMGCPGQMAMLGWRYVLWPAGESDRASFSNKAAETIMKTLVDYNAGPNATTGNGRDRTGTITGVSIETDGGGGNSLDWFCARKNLLKELQQIARVAGGDFDLMKAAAATWEFRWYTGQRGTDRSATVIFSLDRGNMGAPRYRYNRMAEKTVAVVGGRGRGSAREIEIRTGDDYSASNDIEVFVNATNRTTASGLQDAGDARLDQLRARKEFSFDMLQTPACLYGKHYCIDGDLGDLITARYDDIEVTQKIVGVTVALRPDGRESIMVETETQ